MPGRDPYALTQVPSPLVQPGGHFRFPRGKTVVIGEEGGSSSLPQEAPDPTWVGGQSAQDAPAPGTRVDVPAHAPRPVMTARQVSREGKKHKGCSCVVSLIILVAVLFFVGTCSALVDSIYDAASSLVDSGASYEVDYDDYSYDYSYLDDYSYDYGYDQGYTDSPETVDDPGDLSEGGSAPGNGFSGNARDVADSMYDIVSEIDMGLTYNLGT